MTLSQPSDRPVTISRVAFSTFMGSGVIGLALVLGGCGQGAADAATTTSAQGFNHRDVSFAQSMIPRQRQAERMGRLAESRTDNPTLLAMTSRIHASQRNWTTTMVTCLMGWGRSVPQGMMSSRGAGTMMGGDTDGMMSHSDLVGLGAASGYSFDQMYLRMMIRHHRATIALAEAESTSGLDPEVVKLARQVRKAQMLELQQMQHMLPR